MESGNMSCSSISSRVLLQNSEVLDPNFWVANSNPSFQASVPMVNFNNDSRREMEQGNEDYASGCYHQPEKKRRLSPEQVHFLEQSFKTENKLEPERKVQLAKELGLQPRQVAVWFQNRRARYKTKHIEKEYDTLKASYDKLKSDFDSLSKENDKLRNEVQMLTDKLMGKKGEAKPEPRQEQKNSQNGSSSAAKVVCKHHQEDASSAKSDVFDSDSPRYTDPADSSHVLESDFSQDEDDSLNRGLIHSPCLFPKLEEEEAEARDHCLQIPTYSCNLGFSIEDQAATPWFWSY